MTALALSSPQPRSARPQSTWAVALGAALALHIAVIAVCVWSCATEIADDEAGAPAIELAMDMAAPKAEASELPPGPTSDASAAAPDSAQAQPKVETVELPKEEPNAASEPDRIVALQTPKETPRETETPREQPSVASTASIAAEAAAAPALENARTAETARAPVLGLGRKAQQERATWQRRLVAHLDRNKRYPAGVERRAAETRLRFSIDRLGRVQTSEVVASSGAPAFDEAALAMLRRADPLPPPPALVADEGLTFTVPVVFRQER